MELSKRDLFAIKIYQAKVSAWDGNMDFENRQLIVKDLAERFGLDMPLQEAIARAAYEAADVMIKVSEEKTNNDDL